MAQLFCFGFSRAAAACCALVALGGAWACSSSSSSSLPDDPGGNDNYGTEHIGYKTAVAGEVVSSSDAALHGPASGSGGSSDGFYMGAGGAFGGATFETKSWTGPERGAAPRENPFFAADQDAVSTFSIDVDSGSYTLARNAIRAGELPARDEVRVEEFLNYFHFHYAEPEGERPLSLYTEIAGAPWDAKRELVLLGVQGKELRVEEQPAIVSRGREWLDGKPSEASSAHARVAHVGASAAR